MDDTMPDDLDPVSDLPPDDADELDSAADDAPEDDDAPYDEQAEDVADDDEDDADVDDDPAAELERLRTELSTRERVDRERAEREATERLQTQRQQEQAQAQQRQQARQQARATYQWKRDQELAGIAADFELAEKSGDPRGLFAERIALRRRNLDAIEAEYDHWKEQDRQAEQWQMRQALEVASTRQYADHVRAAYNLPHDAIDEIVAYADGTPVHVNAFASRAAEIAERRKQQANLKRQLTRLQREQARSQVRGTSPVPGRGRGPSSSRELEGTIEEARELFWNRGRR